MINYYCPDWYNNQAYYALLFKLRDSGGQCFYPNVQIHTIFGCFPNCIWNGGGYSFAPGIKLNMIYAYFDWYADKGVRLQLTLTNPMLEETDVYDRYGNAILQAACEYDYIDVLVTSPILEEYIRTNYPQLRINKSIISTTQVKDTEQDTLEYYLNCAEEYDMCVLPRKYSKKPEFLSQIPEDKREKFEILVNDPCPLYCPNIGTHYKEFGLVQSYQACDNGQCECSMIPSENPYKQWMFRKDQLNYEEICEILEPLGFTNIKLGGRGSYLIGVLQTVPYLIKPEYRTDVYKEALSEFMGTFVPPNFS